MSLQSKTATAIRDGKDINIAIENVLQAAVVRLRPGERLSVDGVVVEGSTHAG